MAAAKQIILPKGHHIVANSTPKKKTRRRSNTRSKSTGGDIMTIGMAVVVMNMLEMGLKKILGPTLAGLPKYALPALLWIIARKGIIPVKGLETIAQVKLVDAVMETMGFSGLMYNGFTYGAGPTVTAQTARSAAETARQIALHQQSMNYRQPTSNANITSGGSWDFSGGFKVA